MEQTTEQKKVVGYRIEDRALDKEQAKKGMICFNGMISHDQPVRMFKLGENNVKCEMWNNYKGKFIMVDMRYEDLFVKVKVPVYEGEE